MGYSENTARIIRDVERNPEVLTCVSDDPETRIKNIIGVVSVEAPKYFCQDSSPAPGQVAQALSDWHGELMIDVSSRYALLTAEPPDGSGLSKEEANSDPDLQMLQAIRRGVRLAMNSKYTTARGVIIRRPSQHKDRFEHPMQLSDQDSNRAIT